MRPRALLPLLKWTATLALFAGLLAGAYFVHRRARQGEAAEGAAEQANPPRRAELGVVKLGAKLAASHGIQDEPAQPIAWSPRRTVYGRVIPNPQATAEVRSPFAGTLRADPEAPWPVPGRLIGANQVLGRVEVRVGPQERLDLEAKLSDARFKQRGAEDVLHVQQDRVARLQKASTSDGIPRKELDDALVALAEARTQRATAQAAVQLWQGAVTLLAQGNDQARTAWSVPLRAPAEGEVTELAARPGTAVEAGGLVARVVDFQRPLVRLDLPADVLTAGPPAEVELTATLPPEMPLGTTESSTSGAPAAGVAATLVGPAPQVDSASQLAGYWYEARLNGAERTQTSPTATANGIPSRGVAWRPGLFVQASLRLTGTKPQEAVSVPRTAVLFHLGRPWVYVRLSPGRYERREVQLLGPEGERWVLASGVASGEPVVYRHAQVLLSEEFRTEGDND
jgi:hypothetical protein